MHLWRICVVLIFEGKGSGQIEDDIPYLRIA